MTVIQVYIRVYKHVIKPLNLVWTKTMQISTKIWGSPMLILSLLSFSFSSLAISPLVFF